MMQTIQAILTFVGFMTCILFAMKLLEFFFRSFFDFVDNVIATNRARRELLYVQCRLETLTRENEMLQAALDKLTGDRKEKNP